MAAPTTQKSYEFFNKFQTYFYTNITEFDKFSNFQIKSNAFQLLNNMTKGFPELATKIMNIYTPESDLIKFDNCPSLIRALQRNFVNGFSRPKVPQALYYKTLKAKPSKKPKAVKVSKDLLIFSEDVQFEIKSILFYDSKTYEYLKFSDEVQFIGKQLVEEFRKSELIMLAKSKKQKSTDFL